MNTEYFIPFYADKELYYHLLVGNVLTSICDSIFCLYFAALVLKDISS